MPSPISITPRRTYDLSSSSATGTGLDHLIDVVAQVYSFGIVLWELLTRDHPFSGLRYVAPSLGSTQSLLTVYHLSATALPRLPWRSSGTTPGPRFRKVMTWSRVQSTRS
jgi:hypothetical protein